jgi:hypothetical protein
MMEAKESNEAEEESQRLARIDQRKRKRARCEVVFGGDESPPFRGSDPGCGIGRGEIRVGFR